MKKVLSIIFVLLLAASSVFAETNAKKIQALSTELQKHTVVDATRKGYNSPYDVERRKKIEALNKQINQLREEDRQNLLKEVDAMENEHIRLMQNLKTCTRSDAKVFTGNQYVLGQRNSTCYYRIDMGRNGNYMLCGFPMSVANQYAQEAITSIKTGKTSTYVESMTNKYCELKNKE